MVVGVRLSLVNLFVTVEGVPSSRVNKNYITNINIIKKFDAS